MESKQALSWREIQKGNFRKLDELTNYLELSSEQKNQLSSCPSFPLNVPRRLAQKMQKGTLDDPIFKQFVPLFKEKTVTSNFCEHPTQDITFSKTPKLLKKYPLRALLLVTSACAMNCRFCFRQNYPYQTEDKLFEKELEVLENDSSIVEIILSGGDPLSLSDEVLDYLISRIEKIPHIKILRFHSRFPIGIPERITDDFLAILRDRRLQFIFVTHINHPLELDEDVKFHLRKLSKIGVALLNHTVLLQGVNDSLEVLKELNLSLVIAGILPYYLNQLDKVQGSAHFEVSKEKGMRLCEQLRETLPGYAIPRYIEEVPGESNKVLLL